MKNKIITGILVLAAVTLISGATLLASAAPGTQDDPFVTLDYLVNKFKPEILSEVKSSEQALSRTIDGKIADLEERLRVGQGATATPGSADEFSVVTLSKGQSLVCSVGAEVMLRIGTATGFGSAPSLVNYTSGSALSDGEALTVNNMYLVTIEGNGVKATAETVRVLVRGSYKVG